MLSKTEMVVNEHLSKYPLKSRLHNGMNCNMSPTLNAYTILALLADGSPNIFHIGSSSRYSLLVLAIALDIIVKNKYQLHSDCLSL